MRYDILGWDGYSVDDDLNIYSSKRGKDKKMCTYLLKKKDIHIIRLRDGKGGCKSAYGKKTQKCVFLQSQSGH